jgi:osmotically inducible lipoprotein OsmB
MKRTLGLALAFAGALSVSGCYTPQQQTGTLAGGAIGAGGGALIGSALTGGSAGGAIAGGLLGAGTGALIGNAVTAPPHYYYHHRCARWGWNAYGHRVCRAWY